MSRLWTDEEKDKLSLLWGSISRARIAQELGRTEKSIQTKAWDMNLGDPIRAMNSISVHEISKSIGVLYKTLMCWRDTAAFPARRIVVSEKPVWVVKPEAFWIWVSEHPEKMTAADIPRGVICPEPKWVEAERKCSRPTKRRIQRPWTINEKTEARRLIDSGLKFREVAERLGRKIGSVSNEISRQRRAEAAEAAKKSSKLPRRAAR